MSKSNFNCSQAVFVVVAETILNSLEEFLAQFTAYKTKYVLTLIDALRAELLAADLLPDEAARRAASRLLRADLLEQNKACCLLWQRLKDVITDVYAANIVDIQLASAGYARYETASGGNVVETKAMLKSAKQFITDNFATLSAGGDMDAAFATAFGNAVTLFNTTLSSYESSKEAIPLASQEKTDAFNAVNNKLKPILKDGQKIFKDNDAIYTQFVFTHVVSRISGPGLAGARGIVINNVGSHPIQNAMVTLSLASNPAKTYSATTDAEGNYIINCPSGDYKLIFTATGYEPSAIKDISIAVGTVSSFNEKLAPIGN